MSKDDKKGEEKAEKKADKPEKKAPKAEMSGAEKPAKAKGEGGGGEKKDKKKGGGDKPGKGPAEVVKARAAAPEPPRFRVRYAQEVAPALRKQFNYKNVNMIPRLRKIVVNMGLGEAVSNPKIIETAVVELAQLTGQKPVITRAKKAIANFKLREGLAIGAMVTLRKDRMWEFFDRLVNLALPRVRDFKGIPPKAFDGRGNYSLGMREHIVFPEIDYDKVEKIKGLNVSFVTTAKTDEEGRALLGAFGMPFRT